MTGTQGPGTTGKGFRELPAPAEAEGRIEKLEEWSLVTQGDTFSGRMAKRVQDHDLDSLVSLVFAVFWQKATVDKTPHLLHGLK